MSAAGCPFPSKGRLVKPPGLEVRGESVPDGAVAFDFQINRGVDDPRFPRSQSLAQRRLDFFGFTDPGPFDPHRAGKFYEIGVPGLPRFLDLIIAKGFAAIEADHGLSFYLERFIIQDDP